MGPRPQLWHGLPRCHPDLCALLRVRCATGFSVFLKKEMLPPIRVHAAPSRDGYSPSIAMRVRWAPSLGTDSLPRRTTMARMVSRRNFLNTVSVGGSLAAAAGAATGLAFPSQARKPQSAAGRPSKVASSYAPRSGSSPALGNLNLNVAEVETTWLRVPMRPVPARRML